MPVPKRKRSRARRDSRFANKALKVKSFTHCPQCKGALVPHQACKHCGFYKGAKVVATKVDRMVKRVEQQKAQSKKSTASQDSESAE